MVVSSQQLEQLWTAGAWESPGTLSVAVEEDDALLVLGLHWDASFDHSSGPSPAAPAIDGGATLVEVLNQVAALTGDPPVGAQIHFASGLTAGTYTITPPNVGGSEGDGTIFVLRLSGCGPAPTVATTGAYRAVGSAIGSVTVALDADAAAGDLIVGIGGYDNEAQFGTVTITEPSGWTTWGLQDDASLGVPCRVSAREADATGDYEVTWGWDDTAVNVVCALLVAIRYGE